MVDLGGRLVPMTTMCVAASAPVLMETGCSPSPPCHQHVLSFALCYFPAGWSTAAEGEAGPFSCCRKQRMEVLFLSPFPCSPQEPLGIRVQGQLQHFLAEAELVITNPCCKAVLWGVLWDRDCNGHSPVSGATGGHGKYQDCLFFH